LSVKPVLDPDLKPQNWNWKLETGNLKTDFLILRLVVACFPAGAAVVTAILAQSHVIFAEADGAVAVAFAVLLVFLTDHALVAGGFHVANLAPGVTLAKLPKCVREPKARHKGHEEQEGKSPRMKKTLLLTLCPFFVA
jgi:hypothetical protein